MSKEKSVLILSDLHVGALGGLTPPSRWTSVEPGEPEETSAAYRRRMFTGTLQRQMYNWFCRVIVPIKPDVLILNGDLLDGKQKKSGGVGTWSTKLKEQADAAASLINMVAVERKTKILVVQGTPYHDGEYQEETIADALHAEFLPRGFVDVNGLVFDVRHKVGGMKTPAGQPTLRQSMLANLLYAAKGLQPQADVIVRSHLHSFYHMGDETWLGIVTPGFQWASEFGQLEVDRPVSIGGVYFPGITNQDTAGDVTWVPIIARLDCQSTSVLKA